ncbi:GntR family transcriptional regulator [Castellaniella caeni]|uniref:GntR family transcriptional regulator n=1 Tax=Castellaniella caeni TaxID=266123 RepID=UPI00082E1DAE|nr:GntR family transcriptional regulator [Castellaniella caeni]
MIKHHYIRLAQHLTESITQGSYPLGSLLPTEMQLCELYGTSRHTVRAALNELQQLGLVSRRKNVGTRVVATEIRTGFRPTLASLDDLVQFGAEHTRVVQSAEPVEASGELARLLACQPGERWLRIASLRLQDSKRTLPIGWTDVYIAPSYAEIIDEVRAQPDMLISTLIERRYGRRIAEIHQEICACTLQDAAMAQALQLPVGSAALKIVRHYLDAAGQVFEVSVTIHPAERFSVSLQLKRAESSVYPEFSQ